MGHPSSHRRVVQKLAALAMALSSVLTATQGQAQPNNSPSGGAGPVDLSWVRSGGAQTCAPEQEIVARVQTLLQRDPFSHQADRKLEASVRKDGESLVAEMYLRDRQGNALGQRSFDSAELDCTALEDAAVLAIALLIDPNAALVAPPPSTASSGADAAPVQPAPDQPEVGERMVPVWIPVPVYLPSPISPPPPPIKASPKVRSALAFEFMGASGMLPRFAVGPSLLGDVEIVRRVHIAARLSWLPSVHTSDEAFSFSSVVGDLAGCVDVLSGQRVGLGGCLWLGAGAINAVSERFTPIDPGDQPLLRTSATARIHATPLAPVWLGAELGPTVNLIQPRFVRSGGEIVFEPDQVAIMAGIFAGVRFP